jgi:hypothetical protein
MVRQQALAYMRALVHFSTFHLPGKTTFFVANQANIECVPPEQLTVLEAEINTVDDENKLLGAEAKALTNSNF